MPGKGQTRPPRRARLPVGPICESCTFFVTTVIITTVNCQAPVPARHFGSGTCTTLAQGLGGVGPSGPATGVGEGPGSRVRSWRMGWVRMSSFPIEISTASPTTATCTWRRLYLDPTR